MRYLTYEELIAFHVGLMRGKMNETYYGVLNEGLLRSALARPQSAVGYGGADGLKQAAYLALEWFLEMNSLGRIEASEEELIAMCYAAENDKWTVEQIADWLRVHVR